MRRRNLTTRKRLLHQRHVARRIPELKSRRPLKVSEPLALVHDATPEPFELELSRGIGRLRLTHAVARSRAYAVKALLILDLDAKTVHLHLLDARLHLQIRQRRAVAQLQLTKLTLLDLIGVPQVLILSVSLPEVKPHQRHPRPHTVARTGIYL